ncbi:hypothetical protein J6590_035924 [Homalodisca vitripennis]|nr:hypothetical protein J6590_035924 [Homalodisca vitripennis]
MTFKLHHLQNSQIAATRPQAGDSDITDHLPLPKPFNVIHVTCPSINRLLFLAERLRQYRGHLQGRS